MRNRQTSGRQGINTIRARGFALSGATKCAILLSVIYLLCSCEFSALYAAESGGGGQQVASQDYEKMAQETLSDEQWLKLLRQRVHQPIAIWKGIETGKVEANTTGFNFDGLQFENSQSTVLERQISLNGLMTKRPLLTLPLFEDSDPEIVVTGIAAYMIARDQAEFYPKNLDRAVMDRIAEAIRQRLLTHRDVRIRWAAVQFLGQMGWLTLQDIEQGLNDQTDAVRVTTVFWTSMVITDWAWESDPQNPDNKAEPNSPARLTREQFHQRAARLAEILLEHLNDNHFFVRERAGDTVRTIFMQRTGDLQEANPTKKPLTMPRDFDWVRSDWQRRAATQKAWKQWWKTNGTPKTP